MSASAIPAVTAAIESRLTALQATTLVGVTISRGAPEEPPQEWVVLGDASASREYRALSTNPPLDETIRLNLSTGVVKLGDTFSAAETRAFALMDIVEGSLRSDLSLGDTWLYGRLTSIERTYIPVDQGRAVQITFVVEGRAHI